MQKDNMKKAESKPSAFNVTEYKYIYSFVSSFANIMASL